ncbi:DUF2851 family protein [Namhaeicola litoreus]|uniref:DUF2851 family protein n=1 Tax=Namhaeicola litoreus TaxID=1052145 RepID=A0ABW3Y5I8_9FLAO
MQIHEDFLSYLWQYKLFDINNLKDNLGKKITILQSGIRNSFGGPDFFNAKIKIGEQVWAGNVEIHVNASDWYKHLHQEDPFYDNVILHVVWHKDAEILDKHKIVIPCIELSRLTNTSILNNYRDLIYGKPLFVSCETHLKCVDPMFLNHWQERLFIERLEHKSEFIENLLKSNKGDWEQTLYMLLARNFGLNVNGEAFFYLAKTITWSMIKRERYDLICIEALFFGQTNLLKDAEHGTYQNELLEIYYFLKYKYKLPDYSILMQFGRLRPPNFPTIRIAQFAALIHTVKGLFSNIIRLENLDDFYNLFKVKVSTFWLNHYTFQKETPFIAKTLTKSFIDLLVINTFIPLKFVYFKQIGQHNNDLLFGIMEQIKPEKNKLIKSFKEIGLISDNAMRSQALIHLKHAYCDKKRCLECEVGNYLLKTTKREA